LRTHPPCLYCRFGRQAVPPLSRELIYIHIYIFFNNNEGLRGCIKKIFAKKKDRFRLKAVKIIECPGWKAGLYRSSQYIKKGAVSHPDKNANHDYSAIVNN
jgi:hypothetical protein